MKQKQMPLPQQPKDDDALPLFTIYMNRKNDLQSQIQKEDIDGNDYLEELSANLQYNKMDEEVVYYHQDVIQNKKLEIKHLVVKDNIAFVEYEILKKVKPENVYVVQFFNSNQDKKLLVCVKLSETILKYFQQVVSPNDIEDYLIKINDKQVNPSVKFEQFIKDSNQELIIKYEECVQEIQIKFDDQVVKAKININCSLTQIEEQVKNKYKISKDYTIFQDESLKKCANSIWCELRKTKNLNELQFLPKAKENINLEIQTEQQTENMVIGIDGTVAQLVGEIKKNKFLPSIQQVDVYYQNSFLQPQQKFKLLAKSPQDALTLTVYIKPQFLVQYKNKNSTQILKQLVDLSDKLSILIDYIGINNYKTIQFYSNNVELNQTLQFRHLDINKDSIIEYEVIELNPSDSYSIIVQVGQRNYKYSVQQATKVQTLLQVIYDNLLIPDKLDINEYCLRLNYPDQQDFISYDQELYKLIKKSQKDLRLSFRRQ